MVRSKRLPTNVPVTSRSAGQSRARCPQSFTTHFATMAPLPHASTTHPRLLTVDEVASLLRVSKTSVYRLVEGRRLAFFRFPGSLRFSEDDVEAYLRQARVEAMGPKTL